MSEYLNLSTSCNEDSGTLNHRLLLDSCENLSFIDSILEITTCVRLTGLISCEQCSIVSVNLNTCGGSGISLILMSPFNTDTMEYCSQELRPVSLTQVVISRIESMNDKFSQESSNNL